MTFVWLLRGLILGINPLIGVIYHWIGGLVCAMAYGAGPPTLLEPAEKRQ